MTDNEPIMTVATFDTLPQAEFARSLLEEEGIRSFISDGETVNMLWHMSLAVGGIKLQVAKSDFLAAERALHDYHGKSSGRGLDDYGLVRSTSITADPDAVHQDAGEEFDAADSASITADPDAVRDVARSGEDDEDEGNEEAEKLVRTALRAAVLGTFVCPGILHLYSLWLLGGVNESVKPLSPRYRRMFWFAGILDLVMLLVALAFFATVFIGVR